MNMNTISMLYHSLILSLIHIVSVPIILILFNFHPMSAHPSNPLNMKNWFFNRFLKREVLTTTIAGHNCEVLTITSPNSVNFLKNSFNLSLEFKEIWNHTNRKSASWRECFILDGQRSFRFSLFKWSSSNNAQKPFCLQNRSFTQSWWCNSRKLQVFPNRWWFE